MKIVWLVCILLMVGCGGVLVREPYDPAKDIVVHPTKAKMSCLHPEFFKEGMEEFEACIGGKVPFEGHRTLESHPGLKGYVCVNDEFLHEIVNELELCVEKQGRIL